MSAARKTRSTPSPAKRPTPTRAGEPPAVQVTAPPLAGEPPAVHGQDPAGEDAGAPYGVPACTAGGSPAGGGVGSGRGVTVRRTRLNVTEAERLCYSRRKLEAISALRNAGLDPTVFGLHKDYRAEGMRGKVYLVQHPHGLVYVFPTLAQLRGYAAERQARKRHAWRSWDEWLSAPPLSQPRRAVCSWRECGYEAAGLLHGQLWCQIHALLYKQMLLAYGRS